MHTRALFMSIGHKQTRLHFDIALTRIHFLETNAGSQIRQSISTHTCSVHSVHSVLNGGVCGFPQDALSQINLHSVEINILLLMMPSMQSKEDTSSVLMVTYSCIV